MSLRPLSLRQEDALCHLFACAAEFLDRKATPFDLAQETKDLNSRRIDYAGNTVSVRRRIVCDKVVPVWPKVGEAAVLPIIDYIDPHLAAELQNPRGCLKPVEDWPARTPKSGVYADDHEWFALVRAAYERGMMAPIEDDRIFRNQHNVPVLNGAMSVDKAKEGQMLQRFICTFGPLNEYMRPIAGDAGTLPQSIFISRFILDGNEVLSIDGEDLQSCFNLFTLPEEWRGYMAFAKRVPKSVFGINGGGDTYVAVTIVPMGWSASVDIIQIFLRILVYRSNLINPAAELRVGNPFPLEEVAITCLDGFDVVSRGPPFPARDQSGKLYPLADFVRVCSSLGLPLNTGKAVVESYNTTLLGGEIDGVKGTLRHDRAKGHAFANQTLALLSQPETGQAAMQHWAGIYAFAAGFRRPLFSVLEETFGFIVSFKDPNSEKKRLSEPVIDEMLLAAVLLPLARANLRAQLRASVSISDASETGASAAESVRFSSVLDPDRSDRLACGRSEVNELAARRRAPPRFFIAVCV